MKQEVTLPSCTIVADRDGNDNASDWLEGVDALADACGRKSNGKPDQKMYKMLLHRLIYRGMGS